jgi:hypothetical protein
MSVKLSELHRELVIDALEAIVNYKFRALRKSSWFRFETEYLPRAIEQINNNQFTVRDVNNNFFTWIIDQVCHCRVVLDGVGIRDGLPLIDTELGQQIAELSRAASRGQANYDQYYAHSQFHNLFDQ